MMGVHCNLCHRFFWENKWQDDEKQWQKWQQFFAIIVKTTKKYSGKNSEKINGENGEKFEVIIEVTLEKLCQ